jgi:conjugal transfer pilus assembly protein TraW
MNRLSVAHVPCGRALLLLLALYGAGIGSAPAQEEEWLNRSKAILEQATQERVPDWLRSDSTSEARTQAAEIASAASPSASARPSALESPGRVLIFASLAIPVATLRALLEEASAADAVLILRGVPRGSSIQGAIARLRSLLTAGAKTPNVVIDPTLFLRYQVTRVPTLILLREREAPPIVAVGAVTVQWLRRAASKVSRGGENLGQRAEAYDIVEPDFVLEMQARLAGIDWQAKKDAAVAKFWSRHHDFVQLPEARTRREFLVDPSVEATQDLLDADGDVLVRAGDRWNPLNWMVLSKTIIVFRGTDPRQVARAKAAARSAQTNGRGVILLTTDVDIARGWQHLDELEDALAGTVYVLPGSLVERFHLKAIPATIVSHDKQLLVTELPIGGAP